MGRRPQQNPRKFAKDLVGYLNADHPEIHWSQFVLQGRAEDFDEARSLAPHRIGIQRQFGHNERLMLVMPSVEERNRAVLGRGIWWSDVPFQFMSLVISYQRPARTAEAFGQVVPGKRHKAYESLIGLRQLLSFVPGILLLTIASLFFPSRAIRRKHGEEESSERSISDLLLPGAYQFRKGFTPSGILLLSFFAFLVRSLVYKDILGIIPYDKLIVLTGESLISQSGVMFALKSWIVISLIVVYGIHWLQMSTLQTREEELAILARSSKMAADRQAALQTD
jgi:hypothetical protein